MPACPGTALTCSKSHISTTDSSFLREIHTAYAQPEPLTVIRSSQRAPPKLMSLLFFIVLWGPSSGSTCEPGPLLELALAGASAISKENSSNMFFRPQHGNNNKCLTTHQSLLNNNRSHTQTNSCTLWPHRWYLVMELDGGFHVLFTSSPGTWLCTAPPDVWPHTCYSPWCCPVALPSVSFSSLHSISTLDLWPSGSYREKRFKGH